jgi:hypothetical protein
VQEYIDKLEEAVVTNRQGKLIHTKVAALQPATGAGNGSYWQLTMQGQPTSLSGLK